MITIRNNSGRSGRRCPGSVAVVAGPDAGVIHPDRELRHRFIGRRAKGATVADIESGPVQHAFDAAFGDINYPPTARVPVRATVLQCIQQPSRLNTAIGAAVIRRIRLHLAGSTAAFAEERPAARLCNRPDAQGFLSTRSAGSRATAGRSARRPTKGLRMVRDSRGVRRPR